MVQWLLYALTRHGYRITDLNKKSRKENNKKRSQSGGGSQKSARLVIVAVAGGLALVLAFAIFASGGFTKLGDPSERRAALITQALAPSTTGAAALESVNSNTSAAEPKVTIIEFGDYQCNSCGRFHRETKDLVVSNLVDTGKAGFLFKDFPINDRIFKPRDGSTLAAEAAYCAGDQGKFWQYHDELYHNQEHEGVEWISIQELKRFASNVGLENMDRFSQCLESHQYRELVRSNYELAQDLGLNATPTFLVVSEGKEPQLIVGAHPYSSFENAVNQMLA